LSPSSNNTGSKSKIQAKLDTIAQLEQRIHSAKTQAARLRENNFHQAADQLIDKVKVAEEQAATLRAQVIRDREMEQQQQQQQQQLALIQQQQEEEAKMKEKLLRQQAEQKQMAELMEVQQKLIEVSSQAAMALSLSSSSSLSSVSLASIQDSIQSKSNLIDQLEHRVHNARAHADKLREASSHSSHQSKADAALMDKVRFAEGQILSLRSSVMKDQEHMLQLMVQQQQQEEAEEKKRQQKQQQQQQQQQMLADAQAAAASLSSSANSIELTSNPLFSSSSINQTSNAPSSSRPPPSSATNKLKAVWKEKKDKSSGRVFYYNTITKESTWTKPADFEHQLQVINIRFAFLFLFC
jgi:myosin heavy subunit